MFKTHPFDRLLSRVHHYHLTAEGDANPGAGSGTGGEAPPAGADGAGGGASDGQGSSQRTGMAALLDDVDDKAGGGGGSDGGDGDSVMPEWPADWRERYAGNDEKFLRHLKRFASPENFAKSYAKVQRDLAKAQVLTLPDNPTEEQVAEYREAYGIPDSPDGYDAQFSIRELQEDPRLSAALNDFKKYAAQNMMSPREVAMAIRWQEQTLLREAEEKAAFDAREEARITRELQKQYGADYAKNERLVKEWLRENPGIRAMARSSPLNLELMRDLMRNAVEAADSGSLAGGEGDIGGKPEAARIKELARLASAGGRTPEQDAEYEALLMRRARRDEKAGRSRAA